MCGLSHLNQLFASKIITLLLRFDHDLILTRKFHNVMYPTIFTRVTISTILYLIIQN